MKITSVLVSILLVLGCMGNVQSFAQENTQDVMTLSAELLSVDPEEGVLVVKSTQDGDMDAKEITLNVSGDTVILLEDEEIELYDLMTGDNLTIEHYTDETGAIVVTKVHLEYDMMDVEETEISEYE